MAADATISDASSPYAVRRRVRTFELTMTALLLTCAWDGVRLGPAPVSDLLLVLAVPLALSSRASLVASLRRAPWLLAPALFAAAALALGHVFPPDGAYLGARVAYLLDLGRTADNQAVTSAAPWAILLTYAAATAIVPLLVAAASSSEGTRLPIHRALDLWAVSSLLSCGVALSDRAGWTSLSMLLPSAVESDRQFGLATHPNTLGFLAVLSLPVVISWLGRGKLFWITSSVGGASILIAGTVASGSRAAMAGAILAATLELGSLVVTRGWWAVGVPAAMVALAFVIWRGSDLIAGTRFGAQAAVLASDEARARVNARAWMDFQESPLFGIGLDAGAATSVGFLVAGGGLLAVVGFAIYVSFAVHRGLTTSRPVGHWSANAPALVALVCLVVMSFFINPIDARGAYVFVAALVSAAFLRAGPSRAFEGQAATRLGPARSSGREPTCDRTGR